MNQTTTRIIYSICLILCLIPITSPALALTAGILLSAFRIKDKFFTQFRTQILQWSIVMMGFGMNLSQVLTTSKTGVMLTVVSVLGTITTGFILGRIFKVEKNTSLLISAGTAICGGSAIAAVAPVIDAEDHQTSFSLIVVFVLNAVALFLFPVIGHFFNLSQETFGYWAAIAIHDTSSVVGAGSAYGEVALQTATIVKLTRALWIIPVSLAFALFNRKNGKKIKIPWFIVLFVVAILIAHFIPQLSVGYQFLSLAGKRCLVVAIFLIGSNLSLTDIKKAGKGSFLQGILLWIIVSTTSLIYLSHL
jgi:uncharacterized integral membrane protein (TIGR00698 family)